MKTIKCYITENGILSIMENVPINETKEWFKNKAFELSGATDIIDFNEKVLITGEVEYDENHLTIFGRNIEGAIFNDDNVHLSSGNNVYSLKKSNYKDEVVLDINGTTYIRLMSLEDGNILETVYLTSDTEEVDTCHSLINIKEAK